MPLATNFSLCTMQLKSKFQTIVVLVTILFSTTVFSQSTKENSENWQVTSAWVKEVTPEQQAHAIFSAFTALNKKTEELIQYKQDGAQVLWVAKIIACGTAMLSRVSTKNPDIATYLSSVSDLHVSFIREEKKGSQFAERDEQLRRDGVILLGKINPTSYADTASTFKKRLSDTDLSLVVYAMMCATKTAK